MLTIRHLIAPETVLLQVEAHTLDGHDFTGVDLSHAALAHASCRDAVFCGATLRGASFRGAILERANFTGADLSGADLFCADLKGAVLRRSDLSGANLHGADLRGADFFGALLSGADLAEVVCDERTRWPAGMTNCPVPQARSAVRERQPRPASGNREGSAGEAAEAAKPTPWWDRGPRDARWSAFAGGAVLVSVLALLATSRAPSAPVRADAHRRGEALTGTLPAVSPGLQASLPQPAQLPGVPPVRPVPQSAEPRERAPVEKTASRLSVTPKRRSATRAVARRRAVAARTLVRHPRPRVRRPARPMRVARYAGARRERRTHRSIAVVKPYQAPSPAWNHENWFPERAPVSAAAAASRKSPAAEARFSRPRRRKPRARAAEPKANPSAGNSDIHYGSGYDIYRMRSDRSK